MLLNGNEVKAQNGVYNFSSVTVITQPGISDTLTLDISGLNTLGNSIDFISNPV
jgi:hypothetical protein